MNIRAVLLAAGESSRFWPLGEGRHKSTIKIVGKPIILWTIESLMKAGIRDFVIVQNPKKDVEKVLKSYSIDANIEFVIQEEPLGMGDAVMKTEHLIDDYFLLLNPNHFDAHEIVKPMIDKLQKSEAEAVLVGIKTDEPWNYGIFILDEDKKPRGLVEKPEKGKEPSNLRVLGVYLLSRKFFDYHKEIKLHQYSFEDALDTMLKREKTELIITDKKTPSLKYPWHLLDFAKQLMDAHFDGQKIAKNVEISEKAEIIGNVVIEEGTKIFENAVIKGPCYIGKNVVIGNNALVRDHSVVEDNAVVGANAEVTRSIFMDNVHVHSGFFGDTILGENTKVGAGTIFANVRIDRANVKATVKGKKVDTGRRNLGGIVGTNTSIGINCSIMPGKLIGNNVFVGPASIVDENIPSNTRYFIKFEKVITHGG